MSDISERAFSFACNGEALPAVLACPPRPCALGVVIVVGGPQYRAGSHRQFTQLARGLARHGYAVLRFDARGMGDAGGEFPGFEHLGPDIACAIDALVAQAPGVERVALWGLCDGASASLLYLDECGGDPRVAGLCLLNPWVRSETSQARTQLRHYYVQRLLQPGFWAKLLRGKVALDALGELGAKLGLALRGGGPGSPAAAAQLPYTSRMARAWTAFRGSILLVLSGNDYTAKEFIQFQTDDPLWRSALRRPGLERVDLAQADHTFSSRRDSDEVQADCLAWLGRVHAGCVEPSSAARSATILEASRATS